MLQVTPLVAQSWPIPGDVPNLEAIIADQAETITANEVLLHAYQGNLNAAQAPPSGAAATGMGTTSGASTTLTVTGVSGSIANGASITGTGVPPSTILGQISGTTGGAGTYLTSVALTLGAATALTFTPPATGPSTWPSPNDAPTLMTIVQQQTAVLRTQSALLQHYQDLLSTSGTPAPPSGP